MPTSLIVITVLAAAMSLVLVLVVLSQAAAVQRRAKLDKHRYPGPATADLLNYARPLEDGVVLCKDGALSASWLYRGPDSSSTPDAERNNLVARANQILTAKSKSWMVQLDSTRKETSRYIAADSCHFSDPITKAIDDERRRLFECRGAVFDGFFVLTVTYLPPLVAGKRMMELLVDGREPREKISDRTESLLAEFRAACAGLESELSGPFKLERLKRHEVQTPHGKVVHDEQLRWFNFCVTGLDHPIVLPSDQHRFYLDAVIGGQDFIAGETPCIGRQHIRVVAIEGFPSVICPGILDALSEYRGKVRWSTRFIFMDQHQAEAEFSKYRKKWKQKVRGFLDQVFQTQSSAIDRDALAMVDQVECALAEVKNGQTAWGYYTSVVVIMDESERRADSLAVEVKTAIDNWGFSSRIETINAVEAYLGSLPAHSAPNLRRPPMSTEHLAELMPTSTIWTGADRAPCPLYPPGSPALMHCVTHGATPFRLNLHVGDLGHTLMFGPPGSGKSLHLALLVAGLRRYARMQIFAFDKGNSLYALTKAIHTTTGGATGLHLRLGDDDGKFQCCPLQYLDTRSDRAWAMTWIDTMCALNGLQTTPVQRNEIGEAIVSMYESESRTLTEFVHTIQDAAIRNALLQYTRRGQCGQLLDADSDELELSDLTVFEIEELMRMDQRFALPVLLYLFRRIERALQGQPAVIVLDEAWLMLGHPVFRDKIKEWLKVLRRANCAVILATQSISDVEGSGIFDVINESTPSKIFLPNPDARATMKLYAAMGLNELEVDIIATAEKKRHYYYTSDAGKRLYELAPQPLSMAFIAQSDKAALQEIASFEQKYGDGWVDAWLKRHNLAPLGQLQGAA
jgi:type IV secretion system protein VirB4